MELDATKIPDLNRLVAGNNPTQFEKLRGSSVTLTAALFLGIASKRSADAGQSSTSEKLRELALPGVESVRERLGRPNGISTDAFGAPAFELYRIGSEADLLSDEWSLYYDRFRRSAANGKKSDMFRGVGGVLGEMGDNVVSHAFESPAKACAAIAGFYVTPAAACFCVADAGQGFLRSLRRRDIWEHLKTDQEALDAVVNCRATSREKETEGGGFKQLFNSLLDFNGLVIIRSGSCTFMLRNEGNQRRLTIRNSAHVEGSEVTVVICQKGDPVELALPINA
jgi:hypothetical protein